MLFHHFAQPTCWLFPEAEAAPRTGQWQSDLITDASVTQLCASTPWDVLDVAVAPVTFMIQGRGWFEKLVDHFLPLERESRQAIWESTHVLPISPTMRKASAFLRQLGRDRKQRRSRLGARWKRFLWMVLEGMISGH